MKPHCLIGNVITPWTLKHDLDSCSEANLSASEIGLTDWFMYVNEGQRDKTKQHVRARRGSEGVGLGGSPTYGCGAAPDGERRVLNQTETNGVWETERRKFRHMPADLNRPPPTDQSIQGIACVFVCVYVCWEGGSACVTPNKDQRHYDITLATSESCPALQPLHMLRFHFVPGNLIKDWEVWCT